MAAITKNITRWRAGAIHVALSALIAALVFTGIFWLWYPGALFAAAGGLKLFALIAGVDLSIGPLLTTIVYVPRKKGLKFDLTVIALLQLAALAYGAGVLYVSRPAWIVFVKDRFELVRADEVVASGRAKAKPPFDALPRTGPRVVGAELPTDPNQQYNLAFSALAGRDVQDYPQYLVPYARVRKEVAAHAKPYEDLRRFNPGAEARIAALPGKWDKAPGDLGFVPMRAGKVDLSVLVDRHTGDYVGISSLRPWQY